MSEFEMILIGANAVTLILVIVLIVLIQKLSKDDSAEKLMAALQEQFRLTREESARASRELREEVRDAISKSNADLGKTVGELGRSQLGQLSSIQEHVRNLTDSNQKRMESLQKTIAEQLQQLQQSNEKRLDQMRQTVDEKLHDTLEKRLGESFKLVSERLEAVQRGLGEMKSLADGVGDLKRVLTNVKARGTWGEVQLGTILDQMLTPEQYESNVRTKHGSNDMVEFAIRLPGVGVDSDKVVYLPIDSKFPQEDYVRLLDATEQADQEAIAASIKGLTRIVRLSAKDIQQKYVDPPNTTDFAIMFLPTEGLYAEVIRQPGLIEELQNNHRVVVTGPTTLAATLSSLRLGFRTLALEERSAEVWQVLSAVKTEFQRFGEVLDKMKRQVSTVANTLEQTGVRTRAMERTLKKLETLPQDKANALLEFDDPEEEQES